MHGRSRFRTPHFQQINPRESIFLKENGGEINLHNLNYIQIDKHLLVNWSCTQGVERGMTLKGLKGGFRNPKKTRYEYHGSRGDLIREWASKGLWPFPQTQMTSFWTHTKQRTPSTTDHGLPSPEHRRENILRDASCVLKLRLQQPLIKKQAGKLFLRIADLVSLAEPMAHLPSLANAEFFASIAYRHIFTRSSIRVCGFRRLIGQSTMASLQRMHRGALGMAQGSERTPY